MKPTQVLSIICNRICLHFSLCRVWVCFYWFHHVFLILSVILTKYHYIILTYNMLSGYLLQLSVSSKLRRRNRLIIRCANGDFTNKHSNYCQCELLPSLASVVCCPLSVHIFIFSPFVVLVVDSQLFCFFLYMYHPPHL